MENYIAVAIIVFVIGLAALYVYKSKKSGKKCIGCPNCSVCKQNGCNGCGYSKDQ